MLKPLAKLFLISGLTLATSAQAIVDIESLRLDESKQGLSGTVSAKISGKSGNTDTQTYDGALGVQHVEEQKINLFILSAEYTETESVKTDEAYFVHLRHTHKLNETWAWEAYTQYESQPLNSDYIRGLLGGGGRYSHTQGKLSGNLGLGAMYEYNSTEVAGQTLDNDLLRVNVYAKEKYQINDKTKVAFGLYVQPNVEDFNDTVSIASMAYTNKMSERWSMILDVSYKYDSKPEVGLEDTDWQYKFGVNYQFGEE